MIKIIEAHPAQYLKIGKSPHPLPSIYHLDHLHDHHSNHHDQDHHDHDHPDHLHDHHSDHHDHHDQDHNKSFHQIEAKLRILPSAPGHRFN